MSRNVSKEDNTIVRLPQEAIQEDRGVKTCGVPQLVLADPTDVISYKNDRTAIAFKFDTMLIELEDRNGVVTPAAGIAVTFPHQPDAVGFVIDWRQVITGGGALIQGCYRIRVNWTNAGNGDFFYYGSYNLLQYSIFNARNTTRLYVVLNDLVRKQGINYKDSGFAGTVRFEGIFGFMQPNYDTENNTHTNRERFKVRNEALRTYELRTSYLLRCSTRLIDEETLLSANHIWVTDHNANNHDQNFYDFPVILSEDESPSFEYTTGVYAKITAKFLDKVAFHESKYDGNIAGSENVILQLPTPVASCSPATVTLDSATFLTVPSGATVDAKLVDQNDVTIPPISIIGETIKVNLTATQGTTAQLMKTGDPNDGANGRATDAQTLAAIPLDVNGNTFLGANLDRFVDNVGTQVYTDGVVVDRSTFEPSTGKVLCYPINITLTGNVTEAAAETACNSFSTGGFSDWKLWNRNESDNVVILDGDKYFWFAPWNNISTYQYWTSSQQVVGDTTGFVALADFGNFSQAAKTGASGRALPVTILTWNGTILT
jgi:hypothetical protein